MSKPAALVSSGDEVKFMVFGNAGVGKTAFLGTTINDPRTAPVVWLDLEGGTKSIKSKTRVLSSISELGNPQEGLIDVIRVKDFKDLQSAYDWLFGMRYVNQRIVYRSLVIDSLTEVNNACLKHVMANAPMKEMRLELDVPEQRDYLKTNQLMKLLIRSLRDLENLHVFYSALPQIKAEEEVSNLAYLKPNLIGKLADEAVAIMDFVGYLKSKSNRSREMVFQPEGRIVAKERSEPGRWIKSIQAKDADTPLTITQFMDALEGRK